MCHLTPPPIKVVGILKKKKKENENVSYCGDIWLTRNKTLATFWDRRHAGARSQKARQTIESKELVNHYF